jgi:hypothetical protein
MDKHSQRLKEIASHPNDYVGVDRHDLEMVLVEPILFENGDIIAEPDIVFIEKDKTFHVVEYKASFNEYAFVQLRRAKKLLEYCSLGPKELHRYYVYGGEVVKVD